MFFIKTRGCIDTNCALTFIDNEGTLNIKTKKNLLVCNIKNTRQIYAYDYYIIYMTDNGKVFYTCENAEYNFTHYEINVPLCREFSYNSISLAFITRDNKLYFANRMQYEIGCPKLININHDIEYVRCGGDFAICKTFNNTYFSWGENSYGQLGIGSYVHSIKSPSECSHWPNDIIDIQCGMEYTLLLTKEGFVYSFGDNVFGQLGLETCKYEKTNTPILIEYIPKIQKIECGACHTLCIDIEDNLWAFGCNNKGELGLIHDSRTFIIDHPLPNTMFKSVRNISCGFDYSFIKTTDNEIYAFGNIHCEALNVKKDNKGPVKIFDNICDNIWIEPIKRSNKKSARK